MTKHEAEYYLTTEKLIEYYKDKESPVKQYIVTVNNYVNELRNLNFIDTYTELEYQKGFLQVMELMKEPLHPNYYFSACNDTILELLDYEFIVYILSIRKQFKTPVSWPDLCELQFIFSQVEIKFKVKTNFKKDFTQFAIDNITLSDLWTIKPD